jgi:transcription-repair coupling factor (superfamily II helicase)
MGARDLSIIRTPPPNRYPIVTELRGFNEEVIRDTIMFEVSRNGQVFFIHNRVQNIMDITEMISRLCPDVKVKFAHGQMEGHQLEEIMLEFIEGDLDVLVSTSIVESGLDISNANTILINDAQNFGLSDLHQMRGRVGRSNKKAFCYLLSPPLITLTNEARRRLNALMEFSDLGSGFNIAMKDLDIRGSGDILGAEQSGFINEIGYETYQKILAEAIQELKQNEFKDLFTEELNTSGHKWFDDCTIDTDLEVMIPESYIDNIAERLTLYKSIDGFKTEYEIQKFRAELKDRFGAIPHQTEELFNAVRLRMKGEELGLEKITLKNNTLICYFISNKNSAYYQSDIFAKVLQFLQKPASKIIDFKEKNGKLTMTLKNMKSISDVLKFLNMI